MKDWDGWGGRAGAEIELCPLCADHWASMSAVPFRASCTHAFRAIVGLTGTIASGKSHVRQCLADLGAVVVDADAAAHAAYRRGTGCYDSVVATFGAGVVGSDGEIDRKRLGAVVFGDASALERLNAIVWPAVRRLVEQRLDALAAEAGAALAGGAGADAVGVVEAALLFESGWADAVDEVWVCTTSEAEAVRRVRERDGLSEDDARRRLEAQRRGVPAEERARRAAVVIDTSGPKAATRAAVGREWAALLARRPQGGGAGSAART